MHALNVTDVAATIVAGGNRDFVHICNTDDEDYIWVKYDGSTTALTTSNGFPIAPGGFLQLNNDGPRNLFRHPVQAIAATGVTVAIRIQGALEP